MYQVDPFLCARCGKRMSILGFVSDQLAVGRVLDHLGLSAPEAAKPLPIREIVRVAEHGEGWGVPTGCE